MSDAMVRYLGSRERATGTRTFSFERPQGFDYLPGQFFYLRIPSGTGGDWLVHHFSLSSSPTEPDVEFTTRMTGHDFKRRMDELEPGTLVRVSGPDGSFVVKPEMGKVAFVCGGIGITPARSTLRWAADTDVDLDITVLYASKDLASAAFSGEFDALCSNRLRVVYVLSDPEPGWSGRSGRIDADIVRTTLPDWQERTFFVDGPPPMVESLRRLLAEEVGVRRDHMVLEDFPGYDWRPWPPGGPQ